MVEVAPQNQKIGSDGQPVEAGSQEALGRRAPVPQKVAGAYKPLANGGRSTKPPVESVETDGAPKTEEAPPPEDTGDRNKKAAAAATAATGSALLALFLGASGHDDLPGQFGDAFNTLRDQQVTDHLGSRNGDNYEHLPTPSGPNAHVNVTQKMREGVEFFVKKGWTKEQAVGIVANLSAESALNPAAHGDGGHAYGIGQWHEDRQAQFEARYGHSMGESTLNEQLDFVNYELTEGKEKGAGSKLRLTKDVKQAAAVVSIYYERPADKSGQAAARASRAGGLLASLGTPTTSTYASLKGAQPTGAPTPRGGKPAQPDQTATA